MFSSVSNSERSAKMILFFLSQPKEKSSSLSGKPKEILSKNDLFRDIPSINNPAASRRGMAGTWPYANKRNWGDCSIVFPWFVT